MNSKPAILLVDDEKRFIDSLASILEFHDYLCTKAYNGNDAIKLLEQHSFDLALLDVELPDMSGCQVAEFINKAAIPTTSIMLTGIKTVETAVHAMKMGAYDFLNKPLEQKRLFNTLEKALEHNKLKKELATSEKKYQLLSEAAWEGIIIHEAGKIVEANNLFFEMFGYDREDLVRGLYLEDIIPSACSRLIPQSNSRHITKGVSNCTGIKKNSARIPIEVKFRTTTVNNKEVHAWAIRDLTEQLRAEAENLELHKKLAEANKLKALGLMAGSIAHDLNNILTGIVSYPDMLLMHLDKSSKYYKEISKIQSAGKRAAAVVADLVTITRGEKTQKKVQNLNDLIIDYTNSLEHSEKQAEYPSITIETKLNGNINNICCSAVQMHKVLLNLIGNALEAPQTRTITIETNNCLCYHPLHSKDNSSERQEYVKLTIADNGIGIKNHDKDHIFEPFYSTKSMGKTGTGLGLSIVWDIMQNHDGWIEVKNNQPGARFEAYFPASHDRPDKNKESRGQVIKRGQGEKILIIDDQIEHNEDLEAALQNLGYRSSSVTSGEAAIEFLGNNSADLLILDMIMGEGLNGRETLEIILKKNPHQKAIIVSGFAKHEELEKTKELGVSFFLEKPLTLAQVSSAIQKSLYNP